MRAMPLALALGLGFAGEVSCTSEGAPQQKGFTLRAVHYLTDWTWGAATSRAPLPGFRVDNDLGFRVEVDVGYLVTSSVSLAPCSEEAGTSLRVGLLPVAHAGHADVPDPSTLTHGRVEDLGTPETTELAYVEFPKNTYCRVHYLVARADLETASLPSGVDLPGTSLHIEGTFLAPGQAEPQPFRVHSALANGLLWDLDAQGPCREDCVARITIHRALDTLFHGIDFMAQSESEVGRQILSNLIQGARVTVSLEDDHA